jgi:photosystem II oxygen-evolving enhancer protein 1
MALPLVGYAGWKALGKGQENLKAAAVALAATALTLSSGVQPASAGPFTQNQINSLTYDQIKGTGLANSCPIVDTPDASGKIAISGKTRLANLCLEPTSFQVLEEKLTKSGIVTEAVNTKVTTRQTYVLTGIEGSLESAGGKLTFNEQDGIDYAATTVHCREASECPSSIP